MGRDGKFISAADVRAMAQETMQPTLDAIERVIADLREKEKHRLTPEELDQCAATLRADALTAANEYRATIEKTIRGWIAETN